MKSFRNLTVAFAIAAACWTLNEAAGQTVGRKTLTLPLSLTVTNSGAISLPGQQDRYTFVGAVGQRLYFDTLDYDAENISVALYAPSGAVIFNGGHNADYGPFYLTEAGTNTLVLESPGDATGNYSFRMLDLSAASALTLGVTINSSLNPQSQTLVYAFAGTNGQRLLVTNIATSSGNANWRLVSPAGQNLFYANIVNSPGEVLLSETGTHLLMFEGYTASIGSLDFQARLSLVSNPSGTASGFGTVRSGTTAADQTNNFTCTAPAGLPVMLDALTNSSPVTVYLLDPTGAAVFAVNGGSDSGPVRLPRSGTYTLSIVGTDAGSYHLRLLDLSPSGSGAAALALGTAYTATLNSAFKTDVYRFTGAVGQQLHYDALDADSDAVAVLLFDPLGNNVQIAHNSDADVGPFTLTQPGTYFLWQQSQSPDATNDYSFRLIDVAQSPAIALTLDTQINGTQNPGTKADVYRFNGTNGQRLYFDAMPTNSVNATWALFGPNNQMLGQVGLHQDFELTLPQTGSYLLIVNGGTIPPVSYSFRVVTPSTVVSNIALGATVTGTFLKPGDEHRFAFTGTAGQRLFYDALDADFDAITVSLYDPAGNNVQIAHNADSDVGPITLTASGAYTLMIKGNGDTVGDYSFRLVDLAQAPATTLPLDTQVTSTMNPGTEADLYRFNVIAGQRLYFDAMPTNDPAGSWYLYGPDNQQLVGRSLSADFEATLRQTGTHILHVTSGGTNPAGYAIRIVSPNTVASNLTIGATLAGTLIKAGDEHRYTFTGTAGQRLFYDALDADFDAVVVYLYDPVGNNLHIANNADSDVGPFTLATSGTYTLLIKGSEDYVGNYSFRLLDVAAASAITYGVTVTNQLNPQLQAQLYRINGTAGQRLNLTNLAATSGDANWSLFSPNNTALLANTILAPLGEYTLPVSGTYVLALAGNFAGIGTLEFQFRASLLSSPTGVTNGFGTVACGETSADQTNSFTYTAPAGLPVYFDNYTNDSSVNYYLLDPAGNTVFAINGGNGDSGPHYLPASGSYTLQAIGTTNGIYCFRLLDLTSGTTSNLTFGAAHNAPLQEGFRTDVYRFTGTNGQRLTYDALDALAAPDAVNVKLLTPAGAYASINGNVGTDVSPFTLTESGTYYLFVEGQQFVPSDYRFRLIDANLSPAQSLSLGTVYGGELFHVGVVPASWLSVTGSYVNVNLFMYLPQDDWRISQAGNLTGTRVDTNIDFLTSTWGLLADVGFTDGPNGSDGNWSMFSVQWDGTITIPTANTRLYVRSDNSSRMWVDVNHNSQFEYTASEFANNQWGREIVGLSSPTIGLAPGTYPIRIQYEANHPSSASTISLLADTGASLEPAQARVYRFNGTAGQRLFFDSLDVNSSAANWFLYGPNNEPVGAGNLAADFEATLAHTGSYLLVLSASDADWIPFSFRVLAPNTTTNAYTIGATVSGSLDVPGEEDWFSFTATVGQRLYYDALDGDGDPITATLIDPNSDVAFINGNADTDVGPFTLTQTGTYWLRFKGTGDYTNNYSFRILNANAASVLALDTPVTNFITAPFGAVLYQLPLMANLRLFFDDLGASDGCATHTVYDPQNQGIVSTGLGGDMRFTPAQTGTGLVVFTSVCTNVPYAFQIVPINHAPVLDAITNRTIFEQTTLAFLASATDLEAPNDVLTWSLDAGAPANATINPATGLFSWTPSEAQGPSTATITIHVRDDGTPSFEDFKTFTITVNESNQPPVLTLPANTNINELTAYSATATATDADLPSNPLTFALVSGPTNLSVSPSGAINWTPSEAQGPATHVVTISVTDTNPVAVNATSLSITQSFQIVVNEVNNAPLLTLPTNQVVTEFVALSLAATGSDSDLPTNTLTFALVSGPTNLTVSASGAINWTPAEAQGPSTNPVTIRLFDNGSPSLSVTQSFQIVVNESNSPPSLTLPPNTNILAGVPYSASANATDPDLPTNALTFAVIAPPPGLTINASNGTINWTPNDAQAPSTNIITISVTDTNPAAINAKQLSVTNSYTIVLSRLCTVTITAQPVSRAAVAGGTVSFVVNASATGQTNYQWQFENSNLSGETNETLTISNLPTNRFGNYRALVGDGVCTVTSTPAALTLAHSPTIGSVAVSATTFIMQFPTELGPTYVVETRTNVQGATWTLVTTYAGDGFPKTFTRSTQPLPRSFFRIRLQ